MMIFIEQLQIVQFFEFLAACAGSFFLFRTRDTSFIRKFVWFLWITFFVEFFANYAAVAFYSGYEIFGFVKDTPFRANYWLYNIYSIFAFAIYISLFTFQLKEGKKRKWLFYLLFLYVIAAVVNLIFSDVYFVAHSTFTFFIGTIIVVLAIGLYYFQLLRSYDILDVKYSLPFYISIGALVYHLAFVPLVIYSRYFGSSSPKFVEFYIVVLHGINYFLYSVYTLGFIICSKKKKSSLLVTS